MTGDRLRAMPTAVPVFYDCEASGPDGFPIEVGWAFVAIQTGSIQSEAHLIKPPSHWDLQGTWDPEAEALHGISLDQLLAHGHPTYKVARRMNAALAARELFSDSPMDEVWVRQLFDDAGFDPMFTIRRTDANVLLAQLAREHRWDPASYEVAKPHRDVPPRDVYIEKTAAILGIRLDDLYVEAGRLPPDMRENLREVVRIDRAKRQEWMTRMNAAGLLNARPKRNWHEEIVTPSP